MPPRRLQLENTSPNPILTTGFLLPSQAILKYKNLKSLYLHGNQISDMNELLKLRELPELKSLAIHGNPVEEKKSSVPYRTFVIGALPNLHRLDFCTVTPLDREEADMWFAMRMRRGYSPEKTASP